MAVFYKIVKWVKNATYSLVLKVSREINNVIGVATKTIAITIIV
jgi:hypothetical protein